LISIRIEGREGIMICHILLSSCFVAECVSESKTLLSCIFYILNVKSCCSKDQTTGGHLRSFIMHLNDYLVSFFVCSSSLIE